MKPIGAAVVIGVLLSFGIIYILRPLNTGAVAFVVILCVGFCAYFGGFWATLFKRQNETSGKIRSLVFVVVGLVLTVFALSSLLLSYLGSFRAQQNSSSAVPVRAYLFVGEPTPQGYGAYGFLIFNARPSETDVKRYELICEKFREKLEQAWGQTVEERSNQMATFWPLQIPRSSGVEFWPCQKLIETYDYRRAAEIATVIHKQAVSGPILAAWARPFEDSASSQALVLDLSDFADEDLDRAFGIWRDRITRDPAVWRDGFIVVLCREALRSLLQKYGDGILAVINPTKSKQ